MTKLLRDVGAHGHTLFAVEGAGLHGKRSGDIPEFANIQIEVVVSPEVAQTLLARLERDFFPRDAMIALRVRGACVAKVKF